ncbi:MAG: hypothetical protein IT438_03235 [Phycisphaerales bacterium]|nr:hypothetical protein [Phycisphaerales bacterium]
MGLHVDISSDLERELRQAFGQDSSRAAVEARAIEAYRAGKFGSAIRTGRRAMSGVAESRKAA